KLPYRCSAAVTSSLVPDGRAALEHAITAAGAWAGGASLALQAAGIVDSINSMNFEQFIIDLEMWGYFERLSRPIEVDDDRLALDLISKTPSSYMGVQHTLRYFRKEIREPFFGKPQKPESIRLINDLATERLAFIEANKIETQPIDSPTLAELKKRLTQKDPSLASFVNAYFPI
ncbi:MAG: trimethylamine methyltransferase family protein, partial [Deltaproteobacteria bacterium]|nr:trimethylamine methyltransferase family protein [Deltaproteobacteria bacterium]